MRCPPAGCATLCEFSKGGDLDSETMRIVRREDLKIPTLAKTARLGHPTWNV
jgi:hypothetical protein